MPTDLGHLPHCAPWRSAELTAYYKGLMRNYAAHGDRHLPFTPPTTRGSLITPAGRAALAAMEDAPDDR